MYLSRTNVYIIRIGCNLLNSTQYKACQNIPLAPSCVFIRKQQRNAMYVFQDLKLKSSSMQIHSADIRYTEEWN